MKKLVFIILVLLTSVYTAVSQPGGVANTVAPANPVVTAPHRVEVPAEKAKPLRIPRLAKPPQIDGKLDEDVWKQAVVLRDFYQINPGDNIEPSKPTDVFIGYDSRFLY